MYLFAEWLNSRLQSCFLQTTFFQSVFVVVLLFTKEFGFPSLKRVGRIASLLTLKLDIALLFALANEIWQKEMNITFWGMFRSREWFAKYLWHCCSDHEKKSNSHSSPHEHSQWNALLNYIRQVFWVINKVYHVKPWYFYVNPSTVGWLKHILTTMILGKMLDVNGNMDKYIWDISINTFLLQDFLKVLTIILTVSFKNVI